MATPEEQITPADAAIVTTGTGRKGPEEHDLPESLKYDMDLCLEILRNVLGEYNPELLSTFDTVRHYAVEASAEHFAELKDPNPDQDGLKEAVNVIDNMTLHDAQLLARGASPGEVAAQMGYCSGAYFSQKFRAATGHTPSAYRRIQQGLPARRQNRQQKGKSESKTPIAETPQKE